MFEGNNQYSGYSTVIEQPLLPKIATLYIDERNTRKRSGIAIAQYIKNI
jgi:hypothetical protein